MVKFIYFWTFVLLMATTVLVSKSALTQISEDYYISEFQTTYIQALATCRRNGLNIASIRSLEENNVLKSNVTTLGLSGYGILLGGIYQIDKDFQPEWIWVDTGSRFLYTNWYSGQPSSPASYNCVAMGAVSSYSGQWLSVSCSSSYYFACQMDI